MTFLYNIFLAALVASLIPVLLHILSRQRLPVVKFSSLEFLQKLQKKKARRVKLRQLILLAIRTLAVAAIVLVFARPALQSRGQGSSAASVEMVIIIDNGLTSMSESRDGQLLRISAVLSRSLVEIASPGDRLTLLPAAELHRAITVPAGQMALVCERLDEMEAQYIAPDFERSLAMADSIFTASDLFNRELYLVSPFYGPNLDSLRWKGVAEKVRCFIIPVGPGNLDNLSIERVRLRSSILQRGEPVELEAVIENRSDHAVKDLLVSAYLDKERVAQAIVDIPAGGTITRSFSLIPERGGRMAGKVKCEDIDALAADSRRYFIMHIPDSIRVFCVAPESMDSLVLAAALSGGRSGFIHMYWGDPVGWETTSLAGYDVLLLAGVNSVSDGAAQRIVEFMERGGGVIIFQGMEADLVGLSRGLWRRLGFAGAGGTFQEGKVGWGKFDLTHPLFSGIFEKKGSPRLPSFTFAVDLAVGKGDQVIIPLANGRPFLIERRVGRGRALMFAAPLGPQAGDFIYTGIAAPLIFRAVGYAASVEGDEPFAWVTGRGTRVVVSLSRAETARLDLPDGDFIDLPPRPVVGGVEYEVPEIGQPGIYDLKVENRTAARFAANIPDGLSDLRRTDLKDLAERLGDAKILEESDENLAERIFDIRIGRELWQPIAAIFLMLLVSESLIGRAWKREEKD